MNVFDFILFIHIISSTTMGFYFLLPYLLVRLNKITKQSQNGYLRVLFTLNRIGQYALIMEIISGLYLFSHLHLTKLWTVLMIVFVLGIGAFAGILGVRMKKTLSSMYTQDISKTQLSSLQSLGWLSAVSLLGVIVIMCFRNLF